MKYERISPVPASVAKNAIERNDPDELLNAVVAVALHEEDLHVAQSFCLALTRHEHFNVRGNAVLGFGHLARRFGELDLPLVEPALEAALNDENQYVRGHAESARDDMNHFLKLDL